jgi:hypothetical protein
MSPGEQIPATYCKCSCFGRSLMSNREPKALLAAVNRGEVSRAGCELVHRETFLLRQARFEDGLIVVPGFPDGELLRPSASRSSEGGKITSLGGTEDLFGE